MGIYCFGIALYDSALRLTEPKKPILLGFLIVDFLGIASGENNGER